MTAMNEKFADLVRELTAEAHAEAFRHFEASLAGARRELKTMADLCDQMSLAIESISARLEAMGAGANAADPGAEGVAYELPGDDRPEPQSRVLRMETAPGVEVRAKLAAVPSPAAEAHDVPPDSPAWLAPALASTRATKVHMMLRKLAAEGDLTLSGVIYAFSPALKESYAMVLVSDIRKALRAAGCDLYKGVDGVHSVVNKV